MKLPEYIFRGRVNAHGVLLVKRKGVRSYIMNLWQTGYSLYEQENLFVLMFNEVRLLDTATCHGYVIKKSSNGYSTGEWPDSSESNFNSILHLAHGKEIFILIGEDLKISPSDWFEFSDYNLVKVVAFASDLVKPKLVESKVGEESRVLFGSNYQASESQKRALKSISESINSDAGKNGAGSLLFENSKSILKSLVVSWFKTIRGAEGNQTNLKKNLQSEKESLSFFEKIRERILTSRLGNVVGKQNARYLQKMMDMLDDGDFEAGLKHAIPLGSDGFSTVQKTAGFLSARNQLSFDKSASGGGSVNLEEKFLQHLRSMYERTFRQLDKAGRYKEAAFVKAELLKQNDAAVSYLENKKLFQLAAELAEARGLPVTQIIRQWLVAGNKERAIWYTVANDEFVGAITLLENRDKNLANELREIAVERYIATGKYAEAVEIGWPLKNLREKLLNLLDALALDNSATGMAMRVKGIALISEKAQTYATELITLFEERAFSSVIIRQSVISELVKLNQTNEVIEWVVKAALKSLYYDVSVGHLHYQRKVEESLTALIKDKVFKFDINKSKIVANKTGRTLLDLDSSPRYVLDGEAYGTAIVDIVLLHSDYALIALGEMGMLLVNHSGKIVKRYNQPVDRFVPSQERHMILCLSHRDGFLQVFEFEWLTKGLNSIGEYQFTTYSGDYDGALWFVSDGKNIFCIDLKSDDKKIFWRVNDLPGKVAYIKRSGNHINLVINSGSSLQYWKYRFPDLTLECREPISKLILEDAHLFSLSADGEYILTGLYDPEKETSKIKCCWYLSDSSPSLSKSYAIDGVNGAMSSFDSIGKWLFISRIQDEEVEFNLIENKETDNAKIMLTVKINSAHPLMFSEYEERVLVNSAGALVLIDSESGKMYSSYSIH